MDDRQWNEIATILMEEARRRSWPVTASPYGPEEDREAEAGSVRLELAVPGHDAHRIRVLQRGNTIEVAYHDGQPPGPAEAQYVFAAGEERGAIGEAFDFVDGVLSGRVLAVREPLPWWARWVVRSESALRFRDA